jgi:voltage-gated potassium channel
MPPTNPPRLSLLSRFRLPLALLAAVLAYGVGGYVLLEGWSLLDAVYMTVTTLTTVGFREVRRLDGSGQVFTVSLILLGVITVFSAVGVLTQALVDGELAVLARRRRMDRRIQRLRDHYVVCAFGRVGRTVVEQLRQEGHEVLVIEGDPGKAADLEEAGVPYLIADATQEAVLDQAGIGRASGLVCAVDSDAVNVYITLTARSMRPELTIVARAADRGTVDKLERAGADRVVSPYTFSGRHMAQLAMRPAIVDFIDMVDIAPDLLLEEIQVRRGAPLHGTTIGQAAAAQPDVTFLALRKRGAETITQPDHGVTLEEGDLVVVLGPRRALAAIDD